MRRLVFALLLVALCAGLAAQKSPIVNGLNEARFIWRAAEDSLNTYFEDSFSFSLAYNYFTFGLKFNAGLPRYSTDQNQLLDELRPDALGWDWEDLYASYARDVWLIHAGKMEETFGSGMIFRSYENVELDEDYRVTGFKFGYDRGLRLKALYSGFSGGGGGDKLDLAYGMDAEYPVLKPLTLGATGFEAGAQRNATTGAARIVLDNIHIDGPEAVVDHLERVEFPRIHRAIATLDQTQTAADIGQQERAIQTLLGPSMLKAPLSQEKRRYWGFF
mgnify:CR=1 FL=1